tara:strand:+ start:5277 stop:5693 length:417 start_codon:yes stop_codon:yes gene_type:complete
MAELTAKQLQAVLFATDPAAVAALTHHSRKIAEMALIELRRRLKRSRDMDTGEIVNILKTVSGVENNYRTTGVKLRESFDQGAVIAATVAKLAEAEAILERAKQKEQAIDAEFVESKPKTITGPEQPSIETTKRPSSD